MSSFSDVVLLWINLASEAFINICPTVPRRTVWTGKKLLKLLINFENPSSKPLKGTQSWACAHWSQIERIEKMRHKNYDRRVTNKAGKLSYEFICQIRSTYQTTDLLQQICTLHGVYTFFYAPTNTISYPLRIFP